MIAGKFGVFVLDANESATEFRRSTAHDFEMFEAVEDIYFGAPYEKSCLRTLQRIQRNFVGMFMSNQKFWNHYNCLNAEEMFDRFFIDTSIKTLN